jgi:hypothetical protein
MSGEGEFHLDIVIFENIVLTYIHTATGRETKQVLCLVASNKMSSWPSAWISSASTGWHVVKLDAGDFCTCNNQ